MTVIALQNPALTQPVRKGVVVWFVVVHVLALLGIAYTYVAFNKGTFNFAVAYFFACHLSITIGMHRLYAHRAFDATRTLEVILLALSSGTMQASAVWWAAYHRWHHAYADTPRDPYGILHGFLWAHIKWIPRALDEIPKSAMELLENKLVMLQHRFYYVLGFFFALVVPVLACGLLWNDWVGGLLVGGFLRLVLQYHFTWVINSVAHWYGAYRYPKSGTARTAHGILGVILAILTVGEIYHERHHHAPTDWRLGDRWYDFDIGKWVIWCLALVGLATNLRTVPEEVVIQRAENKAVRYAAKYKALQLAA